MNSKNTIAEEQGLRIQELRKLAHLTRRSFGLRHNISPATLQNWENGKGKGLTTKAAARLISAIRNEGIDCNITWLMTGKSQKPTLYSENTASNTDPIIKLTLENHKLHQLNLSLGTASLSGQIDQVRKYIQSGADIYRKSGIQLRPYNNELNTPMHLTASKGHNNIILLLMDHHCCINTQNKSGQTPLHLAVYNGHYETVKLLIKLDADINKLDNEKDSPLAWASYTGHASMVKYLIEKGAKVNNVNIIGNTPLHWATYKGYSNIVKILLHSDADHTTKNLDNQTPLECAIQNGHVEIVEYLITKIV